MKLVETPPGPPVIASVVAEVYGQPDNSYEDLLLAADTVRARLAAEPGVVDVDDVREAPQQKLIFVTDKEKAALSGITTEQIAAHAAGRAGRRHGRPGAQRYRAQSAADRTAAAHRPAHQRGRPGAGASQRRRRPTGAAGRVGPVGDDPRRPDDLSQESCSAWPTCSPRRPAGRRPTWWSTCWPTEADPGPAATRRQARRQRLAEHGRSPTASTSGRSSPTAAASPGACPRASRVDFAGEGRMEDHARRVPRPGPGLRRGDDRDLRAAGGPDGLVRHSAGRHAGDPADDPGRHARLLAAQRAERPAGRRLSRSGLFHGHRHDRHDRPGGHRDPRLDHPGGLHPPVAGARPLAVRRDHGEPRGAPAADPADRHAPPCSAPCRSSSTRSSRAWPGR